MDMFTKAWILIGAGILIRYIIARRQFYRRGVGGLQHFKSFEGSVVIRFIEWVAYWSGVAFIILGLLMLLVGSNRREKENKVQQEQVKEKPPAK